METALTFDDVLLVPKYSNVSPIEADISTRLDKIKLDIPIISAAMDTVTEDNMAINMILSGGLGIIHRNNTIDEQVALVKKVKEQTHNGQVGAAIGVTGNWWDRYLALTCTGVDVIVIDTAHGHSKNVIYAVSKIFVSSESNVPVIIGNVATAQAVKELAEVGAKIIKVGVGPGSICTTRIVTGVGVPQLTAIINCVEEADKHDIAIIADGGIKNSGDIVKAIAAGANAVMIGSLLAGSSSTPGETIKENNILYKNYRGMGSKDAMNVLTSDRYGYKNKYSKFIAEGISVKIPHKGNTTNILNKLSGGIRSAMGYLGCSTLSELQLNTEFIRITNSGISENFPHITKLNT